MTPFHTLCDQQLRSIEIATKNVRRLGALYDQRLKAQEALGREELLSFFEFLQQEMTRIEQKDTKLKALLGFDRTYGEELRKAG